MVIHDTESARRFAHAWRGHAGEVWFLSHAAASQRALAGEGRPTSFEAADHLAAADFLTKAAQRAKERRLQQAAPAKGQRLAKLRDPATR